MRADWTRVTGPTLEPVTLAQVKRQCRVDVDDENGLLLDMAKASRADAEDYLGFGLLTQTWKLSLSGWFDEVWLPMAAPAQSITLVQYYAASGSLSTASSSLYVLDTASQPSRVQRAPDAVWPALQADRATRVFLTYVVGQTDAAAVSANIVSGILILTQARYERKTGRDWTDAEVAARACFDLAGRVYWRPSPCLE